MASPKNCIMHYDGIEPYTMNYYRDFDQHRWKIDVMSHGVEKSVYYDKI